MSETDPSLITKTNSGIDFKYNDGKVTIDVPLEDGTIYSLEETVKTASSKVYERDYSLSMIAEMIDNGVIPCYNKDGNNYSFITLVF